MNWKETFTVFFSSPSAYRPTFWMNSQEVRAAWGLCFHTGDQGTAR